LWKHSISFLLQQQKNKNVDGLGLCQLSENVSVHMFIIVMIWSKIKKLRNKLMKKGLSLWFRFRKLDKCICKGICSFHVFR
jgi:hypothetical protein